MLSGPVTGVNLQLREVVHRPTDAGGAPSLPRRLSITDQSVPVVTLPRFVPEVANKALHVGHAHAESCASLADHVLLDHDTAQIVRTVLQGHLPDVLALRDPRTLDVRNVVQVNAGQRLGAK